MTVTGGIVLGRLARLPLTGIVGRGVRAAVSAAWPLPSRQPVPWWAIVSAGLSPLLLGGAWLVAGALQPPSYSPMRQSVSVLAGMAGTDRWIMTWGLLVVGGLHLVTAAGLAAAGRPARILLLVAGLSSVGIALSPEPAVGSTPQHLAWTALGVATITIWPVTVARRAPPAPVILTPRGIVTVTSAFIILLGWLVIQTQGGRQLGLAERITSVVEVSWPLVVAVVLWRYNRRTAAAEEWHAAVPMPPRADHMPARAAAMARAAIPASRRPCDDRPRAGLAGLTGPGVPGRREGACQIRPVWLATALRPPAGTRCRPMVRCTQSAGRR